MRSLVAIVLTAVLFASCSVGRLPMVKGIEEVKVKSFNKDSLFLDVGLRINNPGTWGYRLKRVDIDITMNGRPVGSIHGKLPFKLITKGDRTYSVVAGVGTSSLTNAIPDLLGMITGKQVKLQMKGSIKMRWFIFGKTIQFDSGKDFKLPKLFGKN